MTALGSRMLAALAISLLLVLVGLAAFPRAQKPGTVSSPQWEYKTVYYSEPSPQHGGPLVERLNREGADGWELADFVGPDGSLGVGTMIFKRIKPSPSESRRRRADAVSRAPYSAPNEVPASHADWEMTI